MQNWFNSLVKSTTTSDFFAETAEAKEGFAKFVAIKAISCFCLTLTTTIQGSNAHIFDAKEWLTRNAVLLVKIVKSKERESHK